jgi:hypothetical protein
LLSEEERQVLLRVGNPSHINSINLNDNVESDHVDKNQNKAVISPSADAISLAAAISSSNAAESPLVYVINTTNGISRMIKLDNTWHGADSARNRFLGGNSGKTTDLGMSHTYNNLWKLSAIQDGSVDALLGKVGRIKEGRHQKVEKRKHSRHRRKSTKIGSKHATRSAKSRDSMRRTTNGYEGGEKQQQGMLEFITPFSQKEKAREKEGEFAKLKLFHKMFIDIVFFFFFSVACIKYLFL